MTHPWDTTYSKRDPRTGSTITHQADGVMCFTRRDTTVRGRVWRNLINVATVHDTEFVHIPAGWGWRVRERATNGAWTTLIDGVEATHQAALSRACRHIRLAHNLDHDPLAPMAPADSWPPAEPDRP